MLYLGVVTGSAGEDVTDALAGAARQHQQATARWYAPQDAPWLAETRADLPALRERRPFIAAFVPAHNESDGIEGTIRSLLAQTRKLDRIVIISDNSTDDTVAIASRFPVTVLETEGNEHRKSGALNMAWEMFGNEIDILVCADGDTVLPPHAAEDWEKEFARDDQLGGSSSQPIMVGGKKWNLRPARGFGRVTALWEAACEWYLPRLQWFEFGKTITQRLACGWVTVISGTGCAYRGEALREVAREPRQPGPWTYESVVEDYHLTYQLRRAGWRCRMSPTVWCWTGAMLTLKSLWYQRIKWTGGTDGDLLKFGFDTLNWRQWMVNALLLANVAFCVLWLALEIPAIAAGQFHWNWWWQGFGFSFAIIELIHMSRLRAPQWGQDWKDWLLAGLLVHLMVYNVLSMSWGLTCWAKVLYRRTLGDLWAPQYRAEGMAAEEQKIGVS